MPVVGRKKRTRQPRQPLFADQAEAEAVGRAQTEIDVAIRASAIEENLESGSPDADSTWFLRHLTEKQRRYGLEYVKTGGNQEKAKLNAGYAKGTPISHIENGDAMVAYMSAVKAELAATQGISANTIAARLNRLALGAEAEGDRDNAIRANVKLGEMVGAFDKKGAAVQINADGVQVVIAGPRSSADDALANDPSVKAILAANGIDLPEAVDAEVFDVQED